MLLYKHFNATLWRKISEAGPKFFEDLQLFHQKNKLLQAVCLGKRGKGELGIDSEKNVEKYSRMCKEMAKGIISYLAYTKKKLKKLKALNITLPEERNEEAQEGWDESHTLKYTPVSISKDSS